MSGTLLEITAILLLLMLNSVFSMSEMALVAARKLRLQRKAEEGNTGARAALSLAANPTNFLSTVQIGITLVGVLAGAFGGAGLAERLAARLAMIPALERSADALALGLVVAIITYLSLVIGELVPKQIALSNPERVATVIARPMRFVSRISAPLVRALAASTNLVLRVLGVRGTTGPKLTEYDIRAMLEQGAETGILDEAEPLDDRRNFHTVAGLVTTKLGRIASVGDTIEVNGWRFEVVRTDGRRIITIRVRAVPTQQGEAPNAGA